MFSIYLPIKGIGSTEDVHDTRGADLLRSARRPYASEFIKDHKDILSHIFWITETFRFLCESCHLRSEMLTLSTKLFFIAAEPLVMGIGPTSTTMLSLCSPFWDMAQEISPAQAQY